MHSIIVIGTTPPCPRCKLLGDVLLAKLGELQLKANVQHWDYKSPEAQAFAKGLGLQAGTAKEVACAMQKPIDTEALAKILKNTAADKGNEFFPYNYCNWNKALDEFLKPLEQIAPQAGILMTPVLIINGQVKHSGCVPALAKIEAWLMELQAPKKVVANVKKP